MDIIGFLLSTAMGFFPWLLEYSKAPKEKKPAIGVQIFLAFLICLGGIRLAYFISTQIGIGAIRSFGAAMLLFLSILLLTSCLLILVGSQSGLRAIERFLHKN